MAPQPAPRTRLSSQDSQTLLNGGASTETTTPTSNGNKTDEEAQVI